MTWFRIDDTWMMHPKAQAAGPLARELWMAGGCYCSQQLTDGRIDKTMVPVLAAQAGVKASNALVLVDVGLWEDRGDHYAMHDFLDFNPSREKVLAERAAAAERQRKARDKAKESREKSHRESRRDIRSESRSPRPDPTRPLTTEGCTNNSSSADCPADDDDPAVIQGREDYKRAVERGAAITDHQAYLEACIANRRAILAQPILPADAPRLPRPHDNCPHGCDHGWLWPDGPDGGVTPCPGEAA